MIWLAWRQFRVPALTAIAGLTALGVFLLVLGLRVRDSYENDVLGCTAAAAGSCTTAKDVFIRQYEVPLVLTGILLIAVPGLIGIFWGAPLVTRELEAGTHRLAWTQSVTKTRWLTAKLGFIALASTATAGLFSLLLTWAASPWDQVQGARFALLAFDSRNVTPLGYAVFAFALGTVVGLLVRRTLPAMAITLALFAGVQVLMPFAIRPHLQPPVTSAVKLTPDAALSSGLNLRPEGLQITGYILPGAWVLNSQLDVFTAAGERVTREMAEHCFTGKPTEDFECLAAMDLHFDVSYHPASRYWAFQWTELSVFLAAAALLAALGSWRIRRDLA
jgi:ABC-type transport system involved in multi-copper enzyme maturation permease subunit